MRIVVNSSCSSSEIRINLDVLCSTAHLNLAFRKDRFTTNTFHIPILLFFAFCSIPELITANSDHLKHLLEDVVIVLLAVPSRTKCGSSSLRFSKFEIAIFKLQILPRAVVSSVNQKRKP